MKSDLQKFFKEQKRKLLPLLIIPIAVLLIAFGGSEKTSSPTPEEELSTACSYIDGVGECRVMVTYKDGEVYAVAVICQGAENLKTREKIVEFITSVYGIGSHRVTVQKMSEDKK